MNVLHWIDPNIWYASLPICKSKTSCCTLYVYVIYFFCCLLNFRCSCNCKCVRNVKICYGKIFSSFLCLSQSLYKSQNVLGFSKVLKEVVTYVDYSPTVCCTPLFSFREEVSILISLSLYLPHFIREEYLFLSTIRPLEVHWKDSFSNFISYYHLCCRYFNLLDLLPLHLIHL